MKANKTYTKDGYQCAMFPMEICNITQGDNVGTHKGTFAVDLAGKDTGRDRAYAPADMISRALDTAKNGNAVIWESQKKCLLADGSIDYFCMMVIHDNDPTGFKPGNTIKQGQQIAQEGTAGFATGNHLHIEVKKGKYEKGAYGMYDRNSYGVYYMRGNCAIEKILFMDDTTIKVGAANWKYTKNVTVPSTGGNTQPGVGGKYRVNVDALNVRNKPSIVTGKITGTLPKGYVVVLDNYYTIADGYVWGRYTSNKGTTLYVAIGKNTGKSESNDNLIKV